MKKAVNYVRGSVCARVECPYPERFVNVCAQNGIEFWDLDRISETEITAHMHISGYRRLLDLADVAGFMVRPVRESGVPFFLRRIKRRYVLLAGMLLCFAAVRVMSLFVWEIGVYGYEQVQPRVILEKLGELGVGVGSFGPGVSTEAISNDMILEIPELSWIAVNVRGSRADVLVRERIPRPEIVDENMPAMVFAEKSGIIVKMSVMEGARAFNVGDTVESGDILVSGIMDSVSSGKRIVHAMAEVYSRTWYELSARMPLETVIKDYTGDTAKKTALVIAGKKINLFFNGGISWSDYDKITRVSQARLPTGNTLPLSVVSDEYIRYTPERSRLSVSDAEKVLSGRLFDELNGEIGEGEIISTELETVLDGGVVTVTLRAECVEQIAAERGFTDEEKNEVSG